MLRHQPSESHRETQGEVAAAPADESRYDAEMLRKVTALAQQLQKRHEATLSEREMEEIGAEVGVDPAFTRQALQQIRRPARKIAETAGSAAKGLMAQIDAADTRSLEGYSGAWWAAGWTIPFIAVIVAAMMLRLDEASAAFFFLGWFVYIGFGVLLSHKVEARKALDRQSPAQPLNRGGAAAPPSVIGGEGRLNGQVSRSTMLDMLFTLQRELEVARQRCTFLSVDVVGSTEMKTGASDLETEYSFGQYRRWVEEIVRSWGGELHSAAGDGIMCMFPTEGAALRAAFQIQREIPRLNAEKNRLALPFRVRCGISAGEVALEPGVPLGHLHSAVIDRAAALQRRASAGGVVVGPEVAAAAPSVFGSPAPLPTEPGQPEAYSWQ